MTEQEREELIEKITQNIVVACGYRMTPTRWLIVQSHARAALAVAEPVIREQADIALREENVRLREEVESLKSEESCNDVLLEYAQAENQRLREENARLREAVKAAYYEGWQDNASIDDTEDRLHAEWEHSEARVAIRETSK